MTDRLQAFELGFRRALADELTSVGILTGGRGIDKEVAHALAVAHIVIVEMLRHAGVSGTGITALLLDAQRHAEHVIDGAMPAAPVHRDAIPPPPDDMEPVPTVVDLATYRATRRQVPPEFA